MADALNLVAQASYNEKGTATGGLQADQNGVELNARQWFSYPWDHIYRTENEEVCEKIADFMEKAVANGFIGYSQGTNERETLYNELNNNGYKVDEVNVNCSCDCSSLVYCAVYGATSIEFTTDADGNPFNYLPMVRHFEKYLLTDCAEFGFEKLEGDEYISSRDNLKRGDILVALGHHIAVWI